MGGERLVLPDDSTRDAVIDSRVFDEWNGIPEKPSADPNDTILGSRVHPQDGEVSLYMTPDSLHSVYYVIDNKKG